MNKFLDKIKHKAKSTLAQTKSQVKEKIFSMTGTSSATVSQIASYIQGHPDTKILKKSLLGQEYRFYHLDHDDIHYYLEMKGNYVLQLDVQMQNDSLVSYRSYRDRYSLNNPIKFPELT